MKDNILVNAIATLITDDNTCRYWNGKEGLKPKSTRKTKATSSSSSLPCLPERRSVTIKGERRRKRNLLRGNAGGKKEDLVLLLISSFLKMKEVGLQDDLQDNPAIYWPLLVRWMWFKGFMPTLSLSSYHIDRLIYQSIDLLIY